MTTTNEPYREIPVRTTDVEYREVPVRTNNGARAGIVIAIIAVLAVIAAFAFGLIDVSQTKQGQMPQVSVQGGQAPAFDVNTAKVNVGSKSTEVTVPDIGTKKEQIQTPTIDVQKAR